jgi:hypothetical protein
LRWMRFLYCGRHQSFVSAQLFFCFSFSFFCLKQNLSIVCNKSHVAQSFYF